MNPKLLGALALGYGTNALLNKPNQQQTGKTPGFGGVLQQGLKDGVTAAIPDIVQQGMMGALGFEKGGDVSGGLWSGMQEVIPFLKSVEAAKKKLHENTEMNNQANAIANMAAQQQGLAAPLSGAAMGLQPAQQKIVDEAAAFNQKLLHDPLPIGYGALYKSTGGTALAKKKQPKPDGWTGATRKEPVKYKKTGGMLASPMGDNSFLMEHEANFKEKVGPLAKTMYKSAGGDVYERSYHNPLASKPDGGKAKEE